MKKTILLLFLLLSMFCFSNTVITPITFKADKQCVTTPDNGELYFFNYFYTRPIEVYFDGLFLIINYANNNSVFLKKKVKSFTKTIETYNEGNIEKWLIDISENEENKNRYDIIEIIIDHRFKIYQIILPTKDKYGENYTSYRKIN
jgi:hypothetical protein